MQVLPVAKKALPVAKRVVCELYAVWGSCVKSFCNKVSLRMNCTQDSRNRVQFARYGSPKSGNPRKTAVSVREWRKAAH